jgi:hypothetical protein
MWKIFLQGHILSTTGDALMHFWRCCGTPQVRDRDVTCWISDQMGIIWQRISKLQSMFRPHQDLTCWISYSELFLCSDWLGLAIFTNKHDDRTKQIWCNLLAASEEYMGYKYGLKTLKMCVMPTSSCDLLV